MSVDVADHTVSRWRDRAKERAPSSSCPPRPADRCRLGAGGIDHLEDLGGEGLAGASASLFT